MNVCTTCIYKNACGTVRTTCAGRHTLSQARQELKKAEKQHDTKAIEIYTALIKRATN